METFANQGTPFNPIVKKPRKWRKLLYALAAVASLYIARATKIDGGLIDDVLNAAVEVVTPDEAPEVAPEVPK